MPPTRFVLLTALGAGIWTDALATAGYFLGEHFEGVWRVIRFKSGKAG